MGWAYGDASMRLGRRRDARDAMQRAADFYDAAGDVKDAQACRDRASDIETRYAADFDTETDRDVRKLLDPQVPLERVRSLTRLVRTFAGAGDASSDEIEARFVRRPDAVLGALWVVHDEVARAILTDFHRAYAAGAAPEEALQSAVNAYRGERHGARGVFYWAPFYLSGLGRSPAPARSAMQALMP